MRLLTLAALLSCSIIARADVTAEEMKAIEKIGKAGADVTLDEALKGKARLRVAFKKLDDKAAAVLKGSALVVSLKVEDGRRCTDKTLTVIGTITNLQELTLAVPNATNAGVASLRGLKELRLLYLGEAKVTDAGIAHLKGLSNLEELDVSETGITSASAATFKLLTALKTLSVSKTKFSDAGTAQLVELKNLKQLNAVSTDVSTKGAKALEKEIPGIVIRR